MMLRLVSEQVSESRVAHTVWHIQLWPKPATLSQGRQLRREAYRD
jgi:hypothetical protein